MMPSSKFSPRHRRADYRNSESTALAHLELDGQTLPPQPWSVCKLTVNTLPPWRWFPAGSRCWCVSNTRF